jgi:hypothetical protein
MTDTQQTAKLEKKMKISVRVYRAETGKWEDIGIIAESEDTIQEAELVKFIEQLEDAGADQKSVLNPLRNVLKKLKRND